MRFARSVAPVTIAVLPLLSKEPLTGKAVEISKALKLKGLIVEYDESGTIGKRYRRNDEAGTPFSVTIDFDTMEDNTVTIRDRDSTEQVRVPVDSLPEIFNELLSTEKPLTSFGIKVK
jgi:glycyl-tRNA synthetase